MVIEIRTVVVNKGISLGRGRRELSGEMEIYILIEVVDYLRV